MPDEEFHRDIRAFVVRNLMVIAAICFKIISLWKDSNTINNKSKNKMSF